MSQYVVFIDDNYHYQDESQRFRHGEFATADEAIEACRSIVERSLAKVYEPGMTAKQLFSRYRLFGEDPFVIPRMGFSAWTYAEERCSSFVTEGADSRRDSSRGAKGDLP